MQKRQFNLSCIENHRWHRSFLQTGQLTNDQGDFTGAVKTLNVKTKIARTEKENDKAPDYRSFAGQTEFGAAWKKTSGAGRELPRIPLRQARRPELPGADLRLAGRGRRRGRLCPHLVPP
jgi:uncharacterized protein (DUF736 family)